MNTNHRFTLLLCAILFGALAIASVASAQTYEGRILGTVRDSSGGVVVNATVTVTNVGTKASRDLATNGAGEYVAPALEPGLYTVSAVAPGFKQVESNSVRLEVATDVRIDLQLQPGDVKEIVHVTEQAPLVDTTNSTLGGIFDNVQIVDLPLQGRDFQNLVMLRPGIDRTPGGGFHSITSNGNRPEDNNYIVDGMDDNDAYYGTTVANEEGIAGTPASHLPIDAIQEFNAEEHPTAEYGWKPGAVVNIGLKSGTNDFHGSLYYFHRNAAFDARNFFDPAPNPVAALLLHQFGASAGGPIVKDKLFIFGNYEGVRDDIGNPEVIPSPATVSVGDPTTSIPDAISLCNATAGCVPNPLSVTLSNLFPTNNGTNPQGAGQIYQDLKNTSREDNFVIKSDYVLSARNTFSGRYFFGDSIQREEDTYVLLPQWLSDSHTRVQLAGGSWTFTPSSRWVNQARYAYNRMWQVIGTVDGSVNPMAYGINTGVTTPADFGMPSIQVGGFTALGGNDSWPLSTAPTVTQQVTDSISYLTGKHTIRFGAEFRHGATTNRRDSDGKGFVYFPTLADFIDSGSTDSSGALGCSSTPCGAEEGSVFVGGSLRHVSQNAFGAYIQDEWHLTPRLTINGGLRYDLATVIKESNDLLGNFVPSAGFVQVGQQISSPYNGDHHNFAPRLGIAWDPTDSGKTAVRAGAGMIYEIPHISAFIGQSGGGEGLGTIPTGAAGVVPGGGKIASTDLTYPGAALGWSPPPEQVFPSVNQPLNCSAIDPDSGDPIPCSITGVLQNLKTPYSIFWNLGVQRAIGRNSVLDVAYVGNRGVDLYSLLDINQPNPNLSLACVNAGNFDTASCEQFARPFYSKFPFLGQATMLGNAEDSIYHSLQMSYTVRNFHGLNLVAGYTYGHALDEASNNRSFLAQNSLDLPAERGNSDFDVRNRFTLAVTYALPSRRSFAHLLEGWQVNSIAIIESGMPFDLHDYDDDISLTGEFNDRWNIIGKYSDVTWTANPVSSTCNPSVQLCYYFPGDANSACLPYASVTQLENYGCYQEKGTVIVPPEEGAYGNIQRNAFRGPDFVNWDFSVMKDTKLREHLTLQLRAEFFNILNHPNFAGVDGELFDGPSVGQVINTPDVYASNPVMGSGGSRHIQLGIKFLW
ncbi:MAG: TonB-dependent receptor [Candidatus Acidiferrales bacterium]